jgi:membrane peptidoglycan carboxypeptidase
MKAAAAANSLCAFWNRSGSHSVVEVVELLVEVVELLDPFPYPGQPGPEYWLRHTPTPLSATREAASVGAARAVLASLHTSGDPGGSTIAQQLAKQLYATSSGFGATLEQIGLGVKLALSYSKPEILNMYLNAVYYGNGYWGDVAAARGYFGVNPDELTWAEAALLAGLPQAPSAYDPVVHLALAKLRQRHVLDQLVANHYLTRAQADAAYTAALPLRGT